MKTATEVNREFHAKERSFADPAYMRLALNVTNARDAAVVLLRAAKYAQEGPRNTYQDEMTVKGIDGAVQYIEGSGSTAQGIDDVTKAISKIGPKYNLDAKVISGARVMAKCPELSRKLFKPGLI